VKTDLFDYVLPPELIAQSAIEPRDSSQLLLVESLTSVPFARLPTVLRPGDLLVVNKTKVRAARLRTHRSDTGGAVEVLLARRVDDRRWEALVRPARRIRRGTEMTTGPIKVSVLSDPVDGVVTVSLDSPLDTDNDLEEVINELGEMPLPPYFHGHLDSPDRYQTMFASVIGSAAAPTAALHFTPAVVDGLLERGVRIAEVELEVGLDTFRPMATDTIEDHAIHTERIVVDEGVARAVDGTRKNGGRVVAVGTTVIRTLESTADGSGGVRPFAGHTDLFITPGYKAAVVDAMITNFHAPRTTLLVLIAALLGDRWRDIYDHAIKSDLRFLSFGDAMFAEVEK
jgi:S-adenosylmethionine:tRNA ribosyltransferase-isomerase